MKFCFFFRLSYHQRIRDMMPEAYNKLIPVPSAPTYKYSSEAAGKYINFLVYNSRLLFRFSFIFIQNLKLYTEERMKGGKLHSIYK